MDNSFLVDEEKTDQCSVDTSIIDRLIIRGTNKYDCFAASTILEKSGNPPRAPSVLSRLTDDNKISLIALLGARPIGIALTYSLARTVVIQELAVLPCLNGKGIEKVLLDKIIDNSVATRYTPGEVTGIESEPISILEKSLLRSCNISTENIKDQLVIFKDVSSTNTKEITVLTDAGFVKGKVISTPKSLDFSSILDSNIEKDKETIIKDCFSEQENSILVKSCIERYYLIKSIVI